MNWVGSTPTVRTGFEMFLLEHFGMNIDFSSNMIVAVVGISIVMLPFFFAGYAGVRGR